MRIGFVGSGLVGSTAAYAMVMNGIGSAIARTTDAILHDQRSIMTVSSRIDDVKDITLSQPCVVGGDGILGTIPLGLSESETAALSRSAETIQQSIVSLHGH